MTSGRKTLERVRNWGHPTGQAAKILEALRGSRLSARRLKQLAAQLLMQTDAAFDLLHYELRVAIKEVAEGRDCPLEYGLFPWTYRSTYVFQAYEAAMSATFRSKRNVMLAGAVNALRHFRPFEDLWAWLQGQQDLMDDLAKQALLPGRRK